MKKLILTTVIALTFLSGFSQVLDTRKKIEVTGAAEQEITPDEIYVGISLQEYMTTNKKKVSIEELEKQLQSAVMKAGIANTDFTINNISSYQNYWEKKKNPMFLASKQYTLKVKDLTKLNDIISAVDPKGIASTNVESYTHSKLETYKKDLKVKALQNAKDKAASLLSGIGEKMGGAIDIQEIYNEYTRQPMYRNTMMMKTQSADESAPMPDIDFKKIKLSYQVRAVFEIK
jgi:uncharacterized protein YggE